MKKWSKITAVFLTVLICSLTAVGAAAGSIYYANSCYYTYINNEMVSLKGWESEESTVVKPPDTLNGRVVVSVSSRAFYGNDTISGVDFSEAPHLKEIGMYAFTKCSTLTEPIILPESIDYLGDCAFEESSVTAVTINAPLEKIPIQCFYNCESLNSAIINGAQEIDSYAFANCPNLSKVVIWDSVTNISVTAFDNDPNLIIYGFADTYAQTYAQEHNIPFVEMVRFLLGDVDGIDGVNINDVTAIQSHLAELKTVEGIYLLAADANQDDIVDISDATAIQMKLADYVLPYPIGQYVTKEVVTQENN